MTAIFCFVTIFIFLINNPLSPKSDQHQILSCNNYMLCKITERITDMITRDEFAWYFIFSPLLLLEMNRATNENSNFDLRV